MVGERRRRQAVHAAVDLPVEPSLHAARDLSVGQSGVQQLTSTRHVVLVVEDPIGGQVRVWVPFPTAGVQ